MHAFAAALLSTAIAGSACAQLGRPLGPAIPAEQATGNSMLLGATRTGENGTFWVTGARTSPTTLHQLYELDAAGQVLAAYDQPPETAASVWGIRDLAWDGGSFLYGGWEGRVVFAFDLRTRQWSDANAWVAPSAAQTVRALAYDARGAAGAGSLWTTDFGSPHVEFDRAGNVLRTHPNVAPLTYGAAFDPIRRSLWWFGQGGSQQPSATTVGIEMDATTGLASGQMFLADASLSATVPGALAGGCDAYQRADGSSVFVLLLQGSPDSICEIRGEFRYAAGCNGDPGFHGDAPFVGNPNWHVDLGGATGAQACLLLSAGRRSPGLPLPGLPPGCDLHLFDLPIISSPQAIGGSAATIPLPIPPLPSLAGGALYTQWAVLGGSTITLSAAGGTVVYP